MYKLYKYIFGTSLFRADKPDESRFGNESRREIRMLVVVCMKFGSCRQSLRRIYDRCHIKI